MVPLAGNGKDRLRLARWPPQPSTPEQVKVNMKDRLARPLLAVHDQAITVLGQALVRGDLGGRKHQLRQDLGMVRSEVVGGGDVPAGDDQDVNRSLGADVTKPDHQIVLEDGVSLQFTAGDPAKEAITHITVLQAGGIVSTPAS